MERKIKIKATPKEVAELLFELDNREVAEVFKQWHKLFEDAYKKRKEAGETIWIFDLNHFMLYVIDEMDEDAHDFIRCAYSQLVYRMVSNEAKKHKLDLLLT